MGFCHNCNKEVSSKFCPNCGAEAVTLVKNTKGASDPTLIDELYALRSGLSRLSQENDKVKEAEDHLVSQRKANGLIIDKVEYGRGQGNLKYFQAQCQYVIDSCEGPNREYISKKGALEKAIINLESESKKWLKKFFIVLPFFFVSIALFVASAIAFEYSEGLIPMGVITLLTSSLLGLTFWCNFAKNHKFIKPYRRQIEDLNKKIKSDEQIQAEINNDPHYIEYNEKYIKAKEEYEKAKTFDYSPYENALRKQKNASVAFYKEFYPAFLAHFEKVLDPRDWCNLDLVIFILETGRADNLRDALIQVDGYRHTEAIVKAVSSASQAICRTIINEADRLQRAISTHVDTINSNLVAISKGQKALSDSLGGINANINKQINATELQNALLEKANTSSDRLSKDLEEIRNYFIK
ncbi:MAG: hypothetical protein IJA82_01330 [Clostridia bacterium]|nr:hypothetical protein [Clostridia bacterium]